MTRAVRNDAHRYHAAHHDTTSRLERFKQVHDIGYEAIRKALFPRATRSGRKREGRA